MLPSHAPVPPALGGPAGAGLGPDGPCLPQSAGVAQRLLMAQELRCAVDW